MRNDKYSNMLIENAVKDDETLSPTEVRDTWDDAFLTNVIVPILEHIMRHDDKMVDEMRLDPEDVVRRLYYERRMVDLDHVIDILKEWRG